MKRIERTELQSNWKIFRWPLVINLASIVGIVSALTGDGLLDLISWVILGGVVWLLCQAYWGKV